MIVTVTPNPSLDRTIEVDHLARGAVLRAGGMRVDAGGKGVNVARAITAHDVPVTAVLPCGGADGDLLVALLRAAGVAHRVVPIAAAVRTNISVVEADGTTTKLNTPGPRLRPGELDALGDAVLAADGAGWVVCSGSLPAGAPEDFYGRLTARLQAAGRRVAVDTSGPPLLAALTAAPDLVKPNIDELADAVGSPITTFGDTVAAAQHLRRGGARTVLASLGAAGALLVSGDGVWHGEAGVAVVRSTVGAGDALLAGFIAAGGDGPQALATAMAWGAAAVTLPGSRMPGPGDLEPRRVRVQRDYDDDRTVREGVPA